LTPIIYNNIIRLKATGLAA